MVNPEAPILWILKKGRWYTAFIKIGNMLL